MLELLYHASIFSACLFNDIERIEDMLALQ